ncbi:MAG TPA: LPS export ABC transporter periplasmic protein LptC [Flavobacteriaceae bacterium]|nr:LPS export ABC transporter periplasmic protein LptC [Flavobacteriaceae bacterium]
MVVVLAATIFFSCKNNFKDVQQIGVLQNGPVGEAKNINLKYTDSGKLKANLLSPKMLDYSNRDFPFSEFPEGIHLDLFDDDNHKSVVLADYAISYSETDLIDLQGNVVLMTYTKDTLFAQQMYYDQQRQQLFTNSAVSFSFASGNTGKGNIFDSDIRFENYQILEGSGSADIDQ